MLIFFSWRFLIRVPAQCCFILLERSVVYYSKGAAGTRGSSSENLSFGELSSGNREGTCRNCVALGFAVDNTLTFTQGLKTMI